MLGSVTAFVTVLGENMYIGGRAQYQHPHLSQTCFILSVGHGLEI
jgi:hypothetical protein